MLALGCYPSKKLTVLNVRPHTCLVYSLQQFTITPSSKLKGRVRATVSYATGKGSSLSLPGIHTLPTSVFQRPGLKREHGASILAAGDVLQVNRSREPYALEAIGLLACPLITMII